MYEKKQIITNMVIAIYKLFYTTTWPTNNVSYHLHHQTMPSCYWLVSVGVNNDVDIDVVQLFLKQLLSLPFFSSQIVLHDYYYDYYYHE